MDSTVKIFELYRPLSSNPTSPKEWFRVPVHLHLSVILVPLLFFLLDWARTSFEAAVLELHLLTLLFCMVLLRSVVHARMVYRNDLGLKRLTLFPICDLVKLMTIAEYPRREKHVALGGMITSFVFPLSFAVASFSCGHSLSLIVTTDLTDLQMWLSYSFWASLLFSLTNLLPIYPFDGGTFFRSVISNNSNRLRSTETTASLSLLFAICFVFLDVFWAKHGFLFLVSIGIFLASQMELAEARFFQDMRQPPLDSGRNPPIYPIDRMVQPEHKPMEIAFSGFTWNPKLNYWIEWRDGQAVAANAILGEN